MWCNNMYENFTGILIVESTYDKKLANQLASTKNCNVWYSGVPDSLKELVEQNNLQTPFIIRSFEPLVTEQI